VVRCSPLYHAIELLRALNLGNVGWEQAVNVTYLVLLGVCGLLIAQKRIGKLLLK
jgi:lipooligosaccharide transport system permease protein